ncbi:Zn(II)2Cys6 transcription factor ASCRUDRAFT_69603 [Ascoidea rubescens DSM 1968]|uniref:Zn(2)-C6 fungal-type domain-containing protein n=1 Tax=Ascoidea rubescens DSM 1968 TaxID=1344418 RepID=A0A1D2VJW2_9ASCO|nr:hypothetical protein ASCRUDRAFT_69603 [Ascoidea rubescens DSM 1968]ODV61878.1 hypothetical protein ASCRUDRAFT_69603 [Ascoidea rubescens DSM 1968]
MSEKVFQIKNYTPKVYLNSLGGPNLTALELLDEEQNKIPKQKRCRTSKACDGCRKKKIKCNGETPCSNCIDYICNCSYDYVPKKRLVVRKRISSTFGNKRHPKKPTLKQLNEKLTSIEGLLVNINEKLTQTNVNTTPFTVETTDLSINRENEQEFPNQELVPFDLKSNSSNASKYKREAIQEEKIQSVNDFSTEQSDQSEQFLKIHVPNNSDSSTMLNKLTKTLHPYHISSLYSDDPFFIFNSRWSKWIQNTLPGTINFTGIFKDLSLSIQNIIISQSKHWTEPISSSSIKPLPNQSTAFSLLLILKDLPFPFYIVDKDEVLSLFHLYYANEPEKKLNYSELLLMNLVLSMATSVLLNSKSKEEILLFFNNQYQILDLKLMKHSYFLNSIYYFHCVCIFCEGIETIKALLLLAIFNDNTFLSKINYMLLSTAVRFAQQIGLDRKENYKGIDEKTALKKKFIWFLCLSLDSSFSLRSGRPPIINISNVTMSSKQEYLDIMTKLFKLESNLNNCEEALLSEYLNKFFMVNHFSSKLVISFLYSSLDEISSLAYENLLGAKALGNKSLKDVMDIADNLIKKLETWRKFNPDLIKPGTEIHLSLFKNNDRNQVKSYELYYHVLMTHQKYYFLVMSINLIVIRHRTNVIYSTNSSTAGEMPINSNNGKGFAKSDPGHSLYINTSTAARKLLIIFQKFDRNLVLSANWMLIYPMISFLVLFCSILAVPKSETAKNDIQILINYHKLFFSKFDPECCDERFKVLDDLLRTIVKISINVYNYKNKENRGQNFWKFSVSPSASNTKLYSNGESTNKTISKDWVDQRTSNNTQNAAKPDLHRSDKKHTLVGKVCNEDDIDQEKLGFCNKDNICSPSDSFTSDNCFDEMTTGLMFESVFGFPSFLADFER